MGFGMLFMGLFWIGLIVGVVWLASALFQVGRPPNGSIGRGRTAREILDERYARGEINREQYDLMRSDLQ